MSGKYEAVNVLSKLTRPGWWFVAAMLLVLSACAGVGGQTAAPLDNREIVARIAKSRWDALLKGDFDAAYKMMSPASREVIVLEDFRRKMGKAILKGASIGKVECTADDLCTVQVNMKYAYKPRVGKEVENEQVLTETWRNTAGGWWYLPADAL